MHKSKNVLMVSIIILIIIFFQGFFIKEISASPFPLQNTNSSGYVNRVINNKLDNNQYVVPAISIVKMDNNRAESQIELTLFGSVNISSRYEYRILLCWDELYDAHSLWQWQPVWDTILIPFTNFTICVAGGASWFGVTNGSCSAFYNSDDVLVFNELNNNSVSIIENDTLIFPINETYITNPQSVFDYVVFTTYNATFNTSTNDIFIDAMPFNTIMNMFDDYYFSFAGLSVFLSGLFVIISATIHTVFIKRKK